LMRKLKGKRLQRVAGRELVSLARWMSFELMR